MESATIVTNDIMPSKTKKPSGIQFCAPQMVYGIGVEWVENFDTRSGMALEEKNRYRVSTGSGLRDDSVQLKM